MPSWRAGPAARPSASAPSWSSCAASTRQSSRRQWVFRAGGRRRPPDRGAADDRRAGDGVAAAGSRRACDDLLGRGVYYGAGRSEAAQCGGDEVIVVGAGNSAGQAVMNLGNSGARVTMLVRGDSLAKSMSAYLVERIEAHPLASRCACAARSRRSKREDGLLAAVQVRDGDGDGRAPARDGALPLHRRPALHRLGGGDRRPGRPGRLHPHRARLDPRRRASRRVAAGARPAGAGDEHPRPLRRRRRPPRRPAGSAAPSATGRWRLRWHTGFARPCRTRARRAGSSWWVAGGDWPPSSRIDAPRAKRAVQ